MTLDPSTASPDPSRSPDPRPDHDAGVVVEDLDAKMQALSPDGAVKGAAALHVGAAVSSLLVVFQLLVLIRLPPGLLRYVPYAFAAIAITQFVAGLKVYRMRGSWALIGLVVAGIHTVAMLGWVLFAISRFVFSPLSGLACLVTILSIVFGALALGACRRADVIRQQLAKDGLDVSF
jgi:hypothetical protein